MGYWLTNIMDSENLGDYTYICLRSFIFVSFKPRMATHNTSPESEVSLESCCDFGYCIFDIPFVFLL